MQYYNKIAKTYKELYGDEQLSKYKFVLTKNSIKKKLTGDILDIGAGDCAFSRHVKGNYYGVEPAKELIINSQYKEFFKLKNIQIQDAENMVLDKKFDLIVSFTAAHHFNDPKRVFEQTKRALKKDGTLVVTLLKKSKSNELIAKILKSLFFSVKTLDQGKDTIYICLNS